MKRRLGIAGNRLAVAANKYINFAWLLILVPLMLWSWDRDPPFQVVAFHNPAPVHAGEDVSFIIDVRRDLARHCSAVTSRQIRDAGGSVRPYSLNELTSAQGIESLERSTPNQVRRTFPVPIDMPVGDAALLTEVSWTCNPLHAVWPIRALFEWPFTVLPPAQVDSITIFTTK